MLVLVLVEVDDCVEELVVDGVVDEVIDGVVLVLIGVVERELTVDVDVVGVVSVVVVVLVDVVLDVLLRFLPGPFHLWPRFSCDSLLSSEDDPFRLPLWPSLRFRSPFSSDEL